MLLQFRDYKLSSFRCDLIAALTVTVLIIPQGMAYAVLAGMPPIYGLYACLVPLVLYPVFGSSRFLSVGPVAIVSVLLLSGLSQYAEPMSSEYISLAIFVSLMAGIIQVLLSLFKMGFLVNFLSHPVLSGFTSAAAVIIIFSQLQHLLGVEVERSISIFPTIKDLVLNILDSNIFALSMGGISLMGILLLKRIKKSFPSALLIVLLSSIIVYYFQLDTAINIIGEVPSGLPKFQDPFVANTSTIISLLPLSFVICLISFIESLAIAKSLGSKHGEYFIDADKELLGLGIAKIGGAFFQAFPNTGSFSRSAINESTGAKTGWSSIWTALLIGLSLLFLTKYLYYIPYPVLAAIIIAAVIKLIDYKEAIHLYKSDKNDFLVLLITFLFTLSFGVQIGISTGIILSLFMIIKKVSTPHVAVLGKIDEDGIYRNIDRFESAEVDDQTLILRYDDDIFFGNAEHFFNSVVSELGSRPATKNLILDLSSVSNIDSTGLQQFVILMELLEKSNVDLHLSGPKGPLRDRLRSSGLYDEVGEGNIHKSIEKARTFLNPSE